MLQPMPRIYVHLKYESYCSVWYLSSVYISILDCNDGVLKFPKQVWMYGNYEDVSNVMKKVFVYHIFAY